MKTLIKANKIVAKLFAEGQFDLANEFIEAITPAEVKISAKKPGVKKGSKRKRYKIRKKNKKSLKVTNPKKYRKWLKWYKMHKKKAIKNMKNYYKTHKAKWKKYARKRKAS